MDALSMKNARWAPTGEHERGPAVTDAAAQPVTVRVLTHELRTPINHIIGYSEILIEDLDGTDSAACSAMAAVHAAGVELLALVNAGFGGANSPETCVSPDILADLRSAVGRSVNRVFDQNLDASSVTLSRVSARDVLKILEAVTRLAEFARTGNIRPSEDPHHVD